MQTKTKAFIAASVATLIGAAAIADVATAQGPKHDGWQKAQYTEVHGKHRHGKGRKGHHKGRHKGLRLEQLLETYDSNEDGKLTQAEIDAVRAERLAKFDGNGDGRLNLQEYEALWLDAMRERMVDRFQRHDDDGNGEVTLEEFGERQARMVSRMDRNGDGEISREDFRRNRGRKGQDEKDSE